MARFTDIQAIDRVISPKNHDKIVQAKMHEQRLVMHTEPVLEKNLLPWNAYSEFLQWVLSFLPKEKFVRFQQMLTVPFDTVDSTKAIFDELSKVFDTQDRYMKFDFTSSDIEAEFLAYLEQIKDADFWKTKGFEALKNGINSILIVDLPAEQNTFRPEPYYYLLSISKVCDIEFNEKSGAIEYIFFEQKGDRFCFFDDEYYRVLEKTNGGYRIISAARHTIYNEAGERIAGLGYCPASPFYNKSIKGTNQVNKRGPLTDVLGKLDWLLFWRASKRYFDLYGAWPIIVSFEETCDYKHPSGAICMSGKINITHETQELDGYGSYVTSADIIDCPACAAKQMIGPGSTWTVPAPRSKDEFNPMEKPIAVVEIDNTKLDYVVTEMGRQEDEIYLDCVGYDGESMNKQAQNENQVAANFESRESVLNGIKQEFERVQKFALETVARLRYGNYFVKSINDWGSEYFLKTVEHLTTQLADAKKNGMPLFYQAELRNKIIQTKTKNNPDQQQRDFILSQLEPYPDFTINEILTLGIRDDDYEGYILKLNFVTFIGRFEREQTNINEFGALLPFAQKIDIITQKLKDYGREYIAGAKPRPNSEGNGKPS